MNQSLADKLLEGADTLSRVWTMANDPARSFAMLTAFRGQYSREENLVRNKRLASDLRSAGFGFWVVDGFWIENQGTPEEAHVAEDSFFVSAPAASKTGKDFASSILKLAAAYEQEGVLLKIGDGPVQAVDVSSGEGTDIGKFTPEKIAGAYSRIRRRNQTFVFESCISPRGWGRASLEQAKSRRVDD